MADYTVTNLREVPDVAAEQGAKGFEARFARKSLEAEDIGLCLQTIAPGERAPFAHRHNQAEEVYVVLSGGGKVHFEGGEQKDLSPLDAVRVAPGVVRSFSAGPDGIEYLALGPHYEKDGEMVQDFWEGGG